MKQILKKVRTFAQENELFDPGQKLCAAVSQDAYCVTGIKNAYDFAITRCGDDTVSRFDRYGFSKDFCCKCIVCDLIIWNDLSIYRSI